jgi:hypothetical protein
MYLLSESEYQDCLRAAHLVRITLAKGTNGEELEPNLIVKSKSLSLKYLLRCRTIHLVVAHLPKSNTLIYALRIPDDPKCPSMLWSPMEREEERIAISRVIESELCHIHLFNEAVVNVGSALVRFKPVPEVYPSFMKTAALSGAEDWLKQRDDVQNLLELIDVTSPATPQVAVAVSEREPTWALMNNHYVTNQLVWSELSLSSDTEGAQQEELAVWLTDWLSPDGAIRSPKVQGADGSRELCDVLLNHSHGCFLIESKSLSILERFDLPDRTKLTTALLKSTKKAVSQLRGGWRNVKAGAKVTTTRGADLAVTREHPPHAIVLVPDLSLLSECPSTGRQLVEQFGSKSGGFLHLLDPGELLRLAQNADRLSRASNSTTPIMAFDGVLMLRWQQALKQDSADFRFTVRLQ